jgi:hypothetical protein
MNCASFIRDCTWHWTRIEVVNRLGIFYISFLRYFFWLIPSTVTVLASESAVFAWQAMSAVAPKKRCS